MVNVKENLQGHRFGSLMVISQDDDHVSRTGKHIAAWKCKCECGNTMVVVGASLKSGNTKSCGCLSKQALNLGRHRHKTNTYDMTNQYGIGFASNTNNPFYFDKCDFDLIKGFCWYESDQGYLVSRFANGKSIKLHRLILNPAKQQDVDHINHNTLDNRRENLRICTRQQNLFNSRTRATNSSGKTGVWWSQRLHKYRAMITVDGKDISLGWFDSFDEAVAARNDAERKFFGEYRFKGVTYE